MKKVEAGGANEEQMLPLSMREKLSRLEKEVITILGNAPISEPRLPPLACVDSIFMHITNHKVRVPLSF